MNKEQIQKHLAKADEKVKQGKDRIRKQNELVKELVADGQKRKLLRKP